MVDDATKKRPAIDDDPTKRRKAVGAELLGVTLGGRYQVDSVLGHGGVGVVYRATHLVLGTPVAVKCLLPQYMHDSMVAQRFLREARAASLIHHPNAMIVHDFGQDGDVTYMVMELLNGASLSRVVGPHHPLLPIGRVSRIMSQVADALAAAHAIPIVHRDLKPGNIVVEDRLTQQDFVKVVDFGIARILASTERPAFTDDITLHQGGFLGTPLYMAPEQCQAEPITPATDVYALGVMLYELLCGKTPFHGKELMAVLMAHIALPPPPLVRPPGSEPVPTEWIALIEDALAKSPAARPPTAKEFRARLLDVATPGGAAPVGRDAPYAASSAPPPAVFKGLVVVVGRTFGARGLLDAEGVPTQVVAGVDDPRLQGATVVVLDLSHDPAPTLEALKVIKSRGNAPPVLVLASDTRMETGRALLAAGANAVVVPPLSGPDLLRRVTQLARRRR